MSVFKQATATNRPPLWLWLATLIWLFLGLIPFWASAWLEQWPQPLFYILFVVKSASECLSFLWAAKRLELGRRLRQALYLSALAYSLSLAVALLETVLLFKWLPPPRAFVMNIMYLCTFFLGLLSMLRMPMKRQKNPSSFLTFLLDLGATVLGLGAALFIIITLPQSQIIDPAGRQEIFTSGLQQILVLIGLTALILNGVPRPSRRSFWLFIGIVTGNLLVVTTYQFTLNPASILTPWCDLATWLTSLCTLWAAFAFKHDAIEFYSPTPGPSWWTSFNPLPLLSTIIIALLLLRAAMIPTSPGLVALAVIMVLQILLLLGRVYLTAFENTRLIREESENRSRLEQDKTQLISQIAGGIAHWYNNLLTVVIGHAELGQIHLNRGATVQHNLRTILSAADRAARLTAQLLSFSGKQVSTKSITKLSTVKASTLETMRSNIPENIELEFSSDGVDELILIDTSELESLLFELTANAVDAMPNGGTLTFDMRKVYLHEALKQAVIPTDKGHYLRVQIKDTGVGIPIDQIKTVFEPFVTTKPPAVAAGLGLAAVHGIIAANQGGLTINSMPGKGTEICFYLPFVTATKPASADVLS